MFGSARTLPTDPLYAQARDLAALWPARVVDRDRRRAGHHGRRPRRGRARITPSASTSGCRSSREPTSSSPRNPKLVSMKYFFTRKLLLIKESFGYAVLPGGFGTLDEAFELLTLIQTGKAEPAPVVLLEMPGSSYWKGWERFLAEEVATRGPGQPGRRRPCTGSSTGSRTQPPRSSASTATITRCAGSATRWSSASESRPTEPEAAELSDRFADAIHGPIRVLDAPLPAERRSEDFPELARVALRFDRISYARLARADRRPQHPSQRAPARRRRRRCRSIRCRIADRDRPPSAAASARPGGVRAARDQPGPWPGHRRPSRRLLRPAGRGRGGRDHHRDGFGDRRRLALRAGAAGRGVRPGMAGRRRGLPPARHSRAGRPRPRRWPGLQRLLPVGHVGAVPGRRRGVPRAAGGARADGIDAVVAAFAARRPAGRRVPAWTGSRSTPGPGRCCASSSPGSPTCALTATARTGCASPARCWPQCADAIGAGPDPGPAALLRRAGPLGRDHPRAGGGRGGRAGRRRSTF